MTPPTSPSQIGFGKDSEGGFGITGKIIGYLPGLDQSAADGLGGAGASGVPVLESHPRQHRRRQSRPRSSTHADAAVAVSVGLAVAAVASRQSRLLNAHPSEPGVVSYAVLGKGSVGNIVGGPMGWESVFTQPFQGVLGRSAGVQQLGRYRVARGVRRPRSGVVQRSHRTDVGKRPNPLRQAGGRGIRHQRRRGPGFPPGGGPNRGLLGTDHRDAPGQRDHAGVVVRRRARRLPPTRTGPSRKPAPIAAASIKPGCAKMFCCRRRSANLATPGPRSTCWPGRCRTRWVSNRKDFGYPSEPCSHNRREREYVGAIW